jgi:hypothetical protein
MCATGCMCTCPRARARALSACACACMCVLAAAAVASRPLLARTHAQPKVSAPDIKVAVGARVGLASAATPLWLRDSERCMRRASVLLANRMHRSSRIAPHARRARAPAPTRPETALSSERAPQLNTNRRGQRQRERHEAPAPPWGKGAPDASASISRRSTPVAVACRRAPLSVSRPLFLPSGNFLLHSLHHLTTHNPLYFHLSDLDLLRLQAAYILHLSSSFLRTSLLPSAPAS